MSENKTGMSRRRVLLAGGGLVAGVGGAALAGCSAGESGGAGEESGGAARATTGAATTAAGAGCYRLTAETTEGPYYIDADKIRRDITEDRTGIPLTLKLTVIDSVSCKPLPNAAVDVWHCDALGLYSGYESQSRGGGGGGGTAGISDSKRYLRGTQLTDKDGSVTFTTVFPGWYRGRCVHIHTKVHVGGTMTTSGYEGGRTVHTGQLFFAESAVLDSAKVAPYSTSTTERTTLDADTIYPGNGAEGGLLVLKYPKGKIAEGVVATLTMGVDPDETHTGTS
ncbi:intradiol ring-cleavage dioxygenase [Streptomyces sp. P9(2023)]|uniref:intradiol ring-cleavage dioxygenase n=1 Tax=Streptomyces sp. P9(2023) TaxID=3064394 RepID=UPI0028F44661|nr:intradiol ring-cleavage dioxygenase [Streptomyces sp. P9(2023)]MDT9691005.1 intradiol ring-cleavage dioxygenase [Streptomyces sp. P9(2023)]